MQTTDDNSDGAARGDAREPETARDTGGVAPVSLTAGLLSAQLVGSDARQVRWAGREAVARVYVGVRDAEWGTIPAEVRLVSERRAGEAFEVRLAGRNAAPSLAVGWEAVISGSADGVFRYSLVATLDEPSRYDRIGLCVLHRTRYLEGSSMTVRQAGGMAVHGVRPTIEPQWSVDGIELGCTEPCRRLEFNTVAGLRVVEEFEGCAFELEDERNFGDGFLKAYGPPLREGYPRQAAAGTVIRQQVTVRASEAGGGVPARRPTRAGPGARRVRRVRVELGSATDAAMPHVGVDYRAVPPPARGDPGRDGGPGPAAEALAALSPSHLRCEVDLRSPGWRRDLDAALRLGAAAGAPLEIAVAVDVPTLAGLSELARLAAGRGLAGLAGPRFAKTMDFAKSAGPGRADPVGRGALARLLLGAVGGGAPTPAHLEAARRALGCVPGDAPMAGLEGAHRGGEGASGGVPVFAATAGEVCELIRDRPRYPGPVGVAFATNPQVHLADDEVIFEGLFGQAAAVRTVRELYPGAAVAVSTVTLRPASGPGAGPPDDPRLDGMCGAAWAAGSVQALAAARVATVTFGLPLARAGGVLRPAFHVLAAAAGMSGRPLLEVAVGDEGLARVVGVDGGDRWRVLVANVSPRSLRVDVVLPPDAGVGRAWVLDEPARAGRDRPIVGEPTCDAGRGASPDRPEGEPACDARPGVALGRLHGALPVPWRAAGMAPGGLTRAFPLRLAGYGVAFFELERHQGGGIAAGLQKDEVPASSGLDRPAAVRLSYQHAI